MTDETCLSNKKPKRLIISLIITLIFLVSLWVGILIFNNISFTSDKVFAQKIDSAILKAENWAKEHKCDILKRKNTALIRMLKDCNDIKKNALFAEIVETFLVTQKFRGGACWIRQIDPNYIISKSKLNKMIKKLRIDYKWMLYALASEMSDFSAQQLEMFEPDRWNGRKLTHQLYALTLLRENSKTDEKIDKLIEHLSTRLTNQLVFDLAVVDIYIQKIEFTLRAGFPEKIKRRWIERMIDNQLDDGGFNDKWFCFTSNRRPVLSLKEPASNQHATLQAISVLYMARYKYPQHFGLK